MKIKRFKLNALSVEGLRQKEIQNGYFSEYNYYVCDDDEEWRYEFVISIMRYIVAIALFWALQILSVDSPHKNC